MAKAITKVHLLNAAILHSGQMGHLEVQVHRCPLCIHSCLWTCASFHQNIPEHTSELVTYLTNFYQPILTIRIIISWNWYKQTLNTLSV